MEAYVRSKLSALLFPLSWIACLVKVPSLPSNRGRPIPGYSNTDPYKGGFLFGWLPRSSLIRRGWAPAASLSRGPEPERQPRVTINRPRVPMEMRGCPAKDPAAPSARTEKPSTRLWTGSEARRGAEHLD